MIVRILIVLVVVGLGFVAVRISDRRRWPTTTVVPIGLTLVTSADCRECVVATSALDAVGAVYTRMNPREADAAGIVTMTVPVAVVGDTEGSVVVVRRGRAVAADAKVLAEGAEQVATS